MNTIQQILSSPLFLAIWIAQALIALIVLTTDMKRKNPEIGGVMKLVWALTVAYSGLLGLWIYYYSGRKQIREDSDPRKGFRSTAHCYSGCGLGEIIGVTLSVGLFSLGQIWAALITFTLAYTFGIILTIKPLMNDGMEFRKALKDSIISESASIVVMEAVAIGADFWLAGKSGMGDILFWSSLIVSLTLGLLAAYPVNLLLIKKGVKEGMHNPKEMAEHHNHDGHGDHKQQHAHAH